MKTFVLLGVAFSLFLSSCYISGMGGSDSSFKSSDKNYSFIQEYSVSSPLTLNLSTSGGSISAAARDGNGIEVAFVVKKRNQVMDITLEELKKLADVEISQTTNSLTINIKRIYERNMSVSFSVKTPVNSSCHLNTSGGSLSISDLKGQQYLNTSGGSIRISKITGQVDANTSGGSISSDNVNGKLHVSTSGGSITISNTKPELIATTSGGSIRLKDIEGTVDVNTSGGSISINNISGSVKASTSGGSINADIVKLTEKLDLETSGGNINATIPAGLGLTLDLSAERINTPLTNFSGTAKKNRINGQMNGGGILVRLSTSGGSVTLNYK